MSKDNGGPAFPLHNHGVQTLGMHLTGMTLRDHFAGLAMQGTLGSGNLPKHATNGDIANEAYCIADEMLKVRGTK